MILACDDPQAAKQMEPLALLDAIVAECGLLLLALVDLDREFHSVRKIEALAKQAAERLRQ